MNKTTAGFTLIEAMIVIAVVGMLAVIAVPGYLRLTQQAAVSELLQAGLPVRVNLGETIATRHALPASGTVAGSTASADPGRYVASVDWNARARRIEVTPKAGLTNSGGAYLLWLAPTLDSGAGSVDWVCGCDGDGCGVALSACRVRVAESAANASGASANGDGNGNSNGAGTDDNPGNPDTPSNNPG